MTRDGLKRKAGHVAAVLVVVGTIAYVARPSPHVPPYDANLVRLAETERQGYCAGVVLWGSPEGEPNPDAATACRDEHRSDKSGRVDMVKTERGFCEAIIDSGWDGGGVPECLGILGAYQLWPTYDGSLSDQWNRARPYPRPSIPSTSSSDDGSRTGTRPDVPVRP